MGTLSCGLTLQIKQILALSFLQSLCKSGAVGAQVSLPGYMADRTQEVGRWYLSEYLEMLQLYRPRL